MERFRPALRRLAAELDVPRTSRAAILLELAADLEAVYEHHRRRGVPEEEAAARAERVVLGSPEVLRRLGRLHRDSWRGWSEAVGARLSGGLDLALLAVAAGPVLALAAYVAAGAVTADGDVFVGSLLAVGLGLGAVVAVESRRLVRGDSAGRGRPGHTRTFARILVLSLLAPTLGLLAFTVALYRSAIALSAGASAAAVDPPLVAALVSRGGGVLLLGALLGLAGALSWLVLVSRSSLRVAREVDAVLDGTAPPPRRTGGGRVLTLVRRRFG